MISTRAVTSAAVLSIMYIMSAPVFGLSEVTNHIECFYNCGSWTARPDICDSFPNCGDSLGKVPTGWTFLGWPFRSKNEWYTGATDPTGKYQHNIKFTEAIADGWIMLRLGAGCSFDPDDWALPSQPIDWNYPVHLEVDVVGTKNGSSATTWRSYIELHEQSELGGSTPCGQNYQYQYQQIQVWTGGTQSATLRTTLSPGQGAKGGASLRLVTHYQIPPGHNDSSWNAVAWDNLRIRYTPTVAKTEATVVTYIDTFNRGGWTAQGNAGYHPPGWTYNGPPSDTAWGGTYCDAFDSYIWPYSNDQYGHRGYKHSKQLNPTSLPDSGSDYQWWICPRIDSFDPDNYASMGQIDWSYPVHFEADAKGINTGDTSITWRSYIQLLPGYTHSALQVHDWPRGSWESKTLRSTLSPGQGVKGTASLEIATNYRIPPGHTSTTWNEIQWDSLRMLYTPICPGLQSVKLYQGASQTDVLNANDSTEYKVQAMVTHPDGGSAVGEIRILFNYTPGTPSAGRGYLCWGQSDADITYYGGTWRTYAASGGGRWGIRTDSYGGLTHITPTGCSTWTSDQKRWVEFAFKVKPAWYTTGPTSSNWISMYSRRAGSSVNSGWHHSYGDPWYGKSDLVTGYFSIVRTIYSSEKLRWGVGVPGQNMIDGGWTTRLTHFEGYRTGDSPWNPLGIGWYQDWNWKTGPVINPNTGETIEYMPLVGGWGPGVHPTIDQIRNEVNANPAKYPDGTTWFIGNEIIWDDNRTPEQYARDHHDFYYGLKSINPTFQVCVGAIITSVTYNRPGFSGTPIQLAQAIWDAHKSIYGTNLPTDAWCIHPYVWSMSTTCEQLANLDLQLNQFRDWMKSVGEQEKPLIIKEYGLLEYHEDYRMIDYLLGSFEVLLSTGHSNGMQADGGRRVQRFAWFCNNNIVWEPLGRVEWTHCSLYNGDSFDMRPLGFAYSTHPKQPITTLTVLSNTVNSKKLINNDAIEYAATIVVEHPTDVNNIRSVREMFFIDAVWAPENGRGFLAWATSDAEFTRQGGTWQVIGNATGGGRWAYRSDAWGSNTYITPVSCITSTCSKRRTVTFRFRVKPAWSPANTQKVLCFTDSTDNSGFWVLSPQRYEIQTNATPTISGTTISSTSLVADNTTTYKVTIKARDTNGIDNIRDVRVMFHNGGAFTSANARGYLCWGLTEADIKYYDSTWTIVGNADGGGKWGWNNGGWGLDTYITPVSAVSNFYLNESSITFTFKVKSAWAPATAQKLRAFTRDASGTNSGWTESSLSYDIRTNTAPTIVSNTISSTTLIADNTTSYSVTLKASDPDGVADIADMRIILDNGIYGSEHGRVNLAWGLTDADIKYYGGEWTLKGNASGGGRWAWRLDGFGSDTYTTPVSASTSTSGNERTVIFTFKVKPAWAPASNQKLRGFARDLYGANTSWILSSANYNVVACAAASITTHPSSQTKCVGQSITFICTGSGVPAPNYQWRKDGANISSATTSSYSINSVSTSDLGNYDCVVSNTCGSATSNSALLWVNSNSRAPTGITASPSTICSGGSSTLSVTLPTGTNGGLLDYTTWAVGSGSVMGFTINGDATENVRISGTDPWGRSAVIWEARPDATSGADGGWNTSTFTIDNTKLYRFSVWVNRTVMGADGRFYLGCYGYGSTNGVIRLSDGTTQTNPYFWTSASPPGSGLPEGQWVLVVGHVFPYTHSGTTNHPDSGRYTRSSGKIGSISNDYKWLPETTSAKHRSYLYYCTDTSVRQQWVYPRVDVVDGTEPSINELLNGFDPDALGTGASWKWYSGSCGGTAVGTGRTISVSPTSTTTYYARAEGTCNTTSCVSKTVTVGTMPSITVNPSSQTKCAGNSVTFTVGASGTAPTYQWRKGGSNISGATTTAYTISSVVTGDAGNYDCVVSNTCGTATSTAATLTVQVAPVITIQPSNQMKCTGQSVSFTCAASGTPTPTYQWRKNGSNISGASSTVYTIVSTTTAHAGNYDCVASNTCGSTTSGAAILNIGECMSIPEAKKQPDNRQNVGLFGKPVTAAFTNELYIEEANRSAGLKIGKDSHGLSVGMKVDAIGTMHTDATGERYLEALALTASGNENIVPLTLTNRALGGEDWYFDSVTGAGQKGVFEGSGLNNIGLLVTCFGKVTAKGADYFYIDDGSVLSDGSGQTGIRVSAGGLNIPSIGQTIKVTGISSCFKLGADIRRLIRATGITVIK